MKLYSVVTARLQYGAARQEDHIQALTTTEFIFQRLQ
jgi:hypothetical protein